LKHPDSSNEAVLILRAQQGERSAFDALVAMYLNRTYQFALRLSGNPDDAADMVAETFLRAYKAIKSFRSEASFTTWLFRILYNAYLDLTRRNRDHRHISIEETLEHEEGTMQRQFADDAPGPQELVEAAETSEALLAAIRKLPEFQQVIILLYHAEGRSYEEIAEIVGLPIGTVKSRMNRARLNLRRILRSETELLDS
jgi:RNA polymerase sigma-70 factor (ECF subfamily)